MLILMLRTDKPEAELYLYRQQQLASLSWHAHRQLAETIHTQIDNILAQCGLSLKQLEGIVAFRGPGSFTGLRIGLSVANALAMALQLPIVSTDGDDWRQRGAQLLQQGKNEQIAQPEYGAAPKTTTPKK